MESLFIHNKMSVFEDALTAALTDLLYDLGDIHLLKKLLNACRSTDSKGQISQLNTIPLRDFDNFNLELWPQLGKLGEPDLLLLLKSASEVITGIIIEVKYTASKSGEDTPGSNELRDQLGRYAEGIDDLLPVGTDKVVIYLTGNSFPPQQELAQSWQSIKNNSQLNPDHVLFWLSWRDVDRTLCTHLQSLTPNSFASRRISRLRKLLKHSGLQCFQGWPIHCAPTALKKELYVMPLWLAHQIKTDGWNRSLAPDPLPFIA